MQAVSAGHFVIPSSHDHHADTCGTPATPEPDDRAERGGSREITDWIRGLSTGFRRPQEDVRHLVEDVLAGEVPLDDFGRWLVAVAEAGESSAEIAGVAAAIRGRMRPIAVDLGGQTVADTCGTGGDGSGSFNISTAAGIVAAAAGLTVAKHGNRAVSSRTGSADVLEHLGVNIDAGPDIAARCLREVGFCFCLAPAYHPAMARVGPLRRSLGRPTVFNLVGPLCNPAGATVQVIGVGRPAAREPVAAACRLLGSRRTLVVSGYVAAGDGSLVERPFDEVSLFGPTDVIDVSVTGTSRTRWTPEDFGLATRPAAALADLEVAGPEASAAAILDVLAGHGGPRRDVVVLNAAAVLWAAGRAADLPTARACAEGAIDSGAAAGLLSRFRDLSHAPPP